MRRVFQFYFVLSFCWMAHASQAKPDQLCPFEQLAPALDAPAFASKAEFPMLYEYKPGTKVYRGVQVGFGAFADLHKSLEFSAQKDLPEVERQAKVLEILRRRADRSAYVSEKEFASWPKEKQDAFDEEVQRLDGGIAQLFREQLGQGVRQENPRLTLAATTQAWKAYAGAIWFGSEAQVAVRAEVDLDPKQDPLLASRPAVNDEVGLLRPPRRESVRWCVSTVESEGATPVWYELVRPAQVGLRLSELHKQLAGSSPEKQFPAIGLAFREMEKQGLVRRRESEEPR